MAQGLVFFLGLVPGPPIRTRLFTSLRKSHRLWELPCGVMRWWPDQMQYKAECFN